ncbi:MAG: hypothetical protein K6A28_09190, partial [Bacteroidales bacterium]|nr:hypothetical protein [Bacteroidales bacterium]
LVRNIYDFDCKEETQFWNFIKDTFGEMEELSSRTRDRVQKSLEHLEFKRTDFNLIQTQGYPILKATFEDYVTEDRPMSPEVFEDYMKHCQSKTYEYWVVFDKANRQLIGFCANRLWTDAAEYGVIGILPEYKHNGTFPYYGLFYAMNQHYLEERGFRYVTDGSRSITEHSNIQPFLEEKFGFRKSYCKLKVYYKWWMRVAVRILYPFRKHISNPSVKAILHMEEMTK